MWISGEGCPGKGTASAKALGNSTKESGGVTEEGGDGDGTGGRDQVSRSLVSSFKSCLFIG